MESASSHAVFPLSCKRYLRFTLGALGLVVAFSAVAAVEYESRELEFSGADINDNGWVVGSSSGSAVLRAGRVRTLASNATANAVNNAGVVVGSRTDASGTHAFRTTPALADAIEDLGLLPGGTYSTAVAINEAGTAVGYADTKVKLPNGTWALVDQAVYFPTGQLEPISLGHFDSSGGKAAYAYGINDHGDIVGAFKNAIGNYQPFLYLASGDLNPLPGFENDNARAIAINTNGRITGNVTYKNGQYRGFIFQSGAHTDIEAPAPYIGRTTEAYGLNDAGQVVGAYYSDDQWSPYLLDNGVTVNLLSITLQPINRPAYAINNRGEILSSYCDSAGCRPKLLTPRRPPPVVRYSGLPLQRGPASSASDAFGSALALHGDVAVIGAPGENGGKGAVYVYRYGDVGWKEESRLTAAVADPIPGVSYPGGFGRTVAFDRNTIVVGAANTAYVFQLSGSGWAQTTILSSGTTSYSSFGAAVAVKGTRIVVGAPYFKENSSYYTGAVYVFDWNGTRWDSTKLISTELPTTSRLLGTSVQLDGDTVLAGAPTDNCNIQCGAGVVYVFQHQISGWSELKLTQDALGFGRTVVVQNNVLAVLTPGPYYYSSSLVYLFRRGTATEGTPWVEQDRVSSYGPVAVDGDRLVVTENYSGKYLPKIIKREGRIWVDDFNVPPEGSDIPSAVALQGSTLLVGSSTGAGVVTPFSICAKAPCPDEPVADVQVKIEAPATARTSELMTHTVVVKNLNTTATAAGLVTTESTFTDSNGIAPSWIGVPDACQVSASRTRVTCGVSGLAANAVAHFELRIAAPAVAGTFTHKVIALHSRPDPAPENNSTTATTAILPSGEARIEVRSPGNGETIKRAPKESVQIEFDIVNFGVGLVGNYYIVTADDSPAQHFSEKQQKLSLGELADGAHSVTIALMTADSATPVVTKTVKFNVELIAPSVVINFPRFGEKITCHKGELVSPVVMLRHFVLGEGGRKLILRIDGIDLGTAILSESVLSSVDLCAPQLDTPHTLQVILRDADGARADSGLMTFEPRKAVPKLTLRQPMDGSSDYARGGFTLIYEFERGYDTTQLAITLNGFALVGPFPTAAGTNAVPLPGDALRDGANELIMTATTEGREVQTIVTRFNTQVATSTPTSKGGAVETWPLTLLLLIWVMRSFQLPGLRITPMREAVSRPSSK